MANVTWHRMMMEDGKPVYSGRTAATPGKGVWVATLITQDGGQTTGEAIAKDGEVVWEKTCRCGYDRHQVIVKAGELLAIIKSSRI